MLMMAVLLASQVIPGQLAVLMHALAESLQFVHKSVPGRSQRSNSAAASTVLSCALESDHHWAIIIIKTTTTTATRLTYEIIRYSRQLNNATIGRVIKQFVVSRSMRKYSGGATAEGGISKVKTNKGRGRSRVPGALNQPKNIPRFMNVI